MVFPKKCNAAKWKIIPSYLKQIMINKSQSRNHVKEIDITIEKPLLHNKTTFFSHLKQFVFLDSINFRDWGSIIIF